MYKGAQGLDALFLRRASARGRGAAAFRLLLRIYTGKAISSLASTDVATGQDKTYQP